MTVVVFVYALGDRMEVVAPSLGRVIDIERRRPVLAKVTIVADFFPESATCGGQTCRQGVGSAQVGR